MRVDRRVTSVGSEAQGVVVAVCVWRLRLIIGRAYSCLKIILAVELLKSFQGLGMSGIKL